MRDVLTAIALVGAMFWIDWQMTLVVMLIAPIVAQPIGKIGRKLRRMATSQQEQTGLMASLVTESLQGARAAKTDTLEPYLEAARRRAFERIRALKMKAANARGRLDPLLEVGGGMAVAGVLAAIGVRITSGGSTVGDFTGYVSALLLAAQPMRSLGNLNAIVQEAGASLKRYYALLDEQPQITERPDARPLAGRRGRSRLPASALPLSRRCARARRHRPRRARAARRPRWSAVRARASRRCWRWCRASTIPRKAASRSTGRICAT